MSDSDDEDGILFGGSLNNIKDAMGEADEADAANEVAAQETASAVEAAINGLSLALLSNDINMLEEPISRLSAAGVDLETDGKPAATYAEELRQSMSSLLGGRYGEVLTSPLAQKLLTEANDDSSGGNGNHESTLSSTELVTLLRERALAHVSAATNDLEASLRCLELQLVGVAALNWFLQANYTGPTLTESDAPPRLLLSSSSLVHQCLGVDGELPYSGSTGAAFLLLARSLLAAIADPTYPSWTVPVTAKDDGAESAPAQGATAATASERPTADSSQQNSGVLNTSAFDERPRQRASLRCVLGAKPLQASTACWSVRATVTHQRLLLAGEPTQTLWAEVSAGLNHALREYAGGSDPKLHGGRVTSALATEVWLEHGLAQYHFNKGDLGKVSFNAARKSAVLQVQLTGSLGRRTKFQTRSVAQMVLKASTADGPGDASGGEEEEEEETSKPFKTATLTAKWEQMAAEKEAAAAAAATGIDIGTEAPPAPVVPAGDSDLLPPIAPADAAAATIDGSETTPTGNGDASLAPRVEKQAEDSILLERTKFDDQAEAAEEKLEKHHLSVLLALCLDVKNSNPKDGLTAEEMQPYVARVLLHHQDWTIYSTALLQRAWLDFESQYAKDRATMQIQALVDQHGTALTFTQLSYDAIANSAPAEERIRALHSVVYPPCWELKKDLAQRYAALGILVSAAQLFEELELWDDVVDCNSRMGRKAQALELVRARLLVHPTPRMLCALGDLSEAPESTKHYEEAWALSGKRFARAKRLIGREAVNLSQACAQSEVEERQKDSDKTNRGLKTDVAKADRLKDESKAHLVRAGAALSEALALQPSVTSDWFVLGTVRMRLEEWQEALTAFSTVVAHAPDSGDAWGNVGAIHLRLKRPDLAVAAFTEGLKASRDSWRMWENKLLATLQVRPLPSVADAAYCATQLLDLHARGLGRGLDTPLLAAIASAALKAEGLSASTGGDPSLLAPPLQDESLDSPLFAARPIPRQVGVLLARVGASTSMAASDPKVWEVCAVFNVGLGRRQHARDDRLKHVRALMQVVGWDKKAPELSALADAIQELVMLHALPTAHSANEAQQLHGVALLVRGVLKKAEAFGAVGPSGDKARETLRSALAAVEKQVAALDDASK